MKWKKDYLIALPIFIVILNMILVANGTMLTFDIWIHSKIVHIDILTNILLFLTNFGSVKYIVGISILLLIFHKPKKELTNLYGVIIVSTIINNIIKFIFRRPRPELMYIANLAIEKTYCFPSGHAMATMTFYGFLIYMIYKREMNKSLKVTLITLLSLLIFIVGFSRIYLYVHYFSDVFTGYLCSIIIIFFYNKSTKNIKFLNSK